RDPPADPARLATARARGRAGPGRTVRRGHARVPVVASRRSSGRTPAGRLAHRRDQNGRGSPDRVRRECGDGGCACRTAGVSSSRSKSTGGRAVPERAVVLLRGTQPRSPGARVKRVLLLATTTGYQTRMFGDAAERLGVELVFATDRCDVLDDPWRDRAIPIRFHDEDASVAAILEHAGRQPINGVLVVGDRPTVVAALAAQELRLTSHQPLAAAVSRNKLLTRERLRDCDCL